MGLRVKALLLHIRLLPSSLSLRGGDLFFDLIRAFPSYLPSTAVDVGAHFGELIRPLHRWTPNVELLCIEPTPSSFERLTFAARKYPKTRCIQVAVGSKPGAAVLATSAHSELNSLRDFAYDSTLTKNLTEVQVVTLDQICTKESLSRLGLLKIDTEGGDLEVLRGGEGLLREQRVDILQVEAGMNPENRRHVPLMDFQFHLEPLGYRLFGLYEQMHEWPTSSPNLRRVNAVFISHRMLSSG